MRIALMAVLGLIGLAMLPAANASSSGPVRAQAGSNPYLIEAAQGCGPGYHWVGRHRNRYGAWVPGHCARN